MGSSVVLSTASFFPDTRSAFRMAADCGYDGVEVMVNYDRNSQSVDSVQALARQYGVPVTAVHVPCLVVSQHVWGFSPEAKLRRSVDMAGAVGADVVVVHPPFRWQRGASDSFAAAIAELDSAGPRVTVENMYGVDALGRRVQPWVWSDAESLLRFPSLTLDTSHAGADRVDLLDLYEKTKGRIRHLHLSDSTATRGDEHLPPGAGTLALEELAQAMVGDGFDGQVVIEVGIGRLPAAARASATSDCAAWARAAFGR